MTFADESRAARVGMLVKKLVRSRITGVVLAVASLIVIFDRWGDAPWDRLSEVRPSSLALSAVAYAIAPVALAYGAFGSIRGEVGGAGLATQLLKYVPGTVWQAHPIYATAGAQGVASYGLSVLLAASLALAISGLPLATVSGAVAAFIVAGFVWYRQGAALTLRMTTTALIAVFALALSGAALATAFDVDPLTTGTRVSAAWGAGVWAVPVPAGLGVREAFLAITSGPDLAPLVATHRLVTLVADVVLGLLGLGLLKVQRGANTSRRNFPV